MFSLKPLINSNLVDNSGCFQMKDPFLPFFPWLSLSLVVCMLARELHHANVPCLFSVAAPSPYFFKIYFSRAWVPLGTISHIYLNKWGEWGEFWVWGNGAGTCSCGLEIVNENAHFAPHPHRKRYLCNAFEKKIEENQV